jgi:hypothetical protein
LATTIVSISRSTSIISSSTNRHQVARWSTKPVHVSNGQQGQVWQGLLPGTPGNSGRTTALAALQFLLRFGLKLNPRRLDRLDGEIASLAVIGV